MAAEGGGLSWSPAQSAGVPPLAGAERLLMMKVDNLAPVPALRVRAMPASSLVSDLSRPSLDRLQAAGLAELLAEILPRHPFYAHKLAGISLSRLSLPRDLEQIPFTTRAELLTAQAEQPPHGGLITYPFADYVRM